MVNDRYLIFGLTRSTFSTIVGWIGVVIFEADVAPNEGDPK